MPSKRKRPENASGSLHQEERSKDEEDLEKEVAKIGKAEYDPNGNALGLTFHRSSFIGNIGDFPSFVSGLSGLSQYYFSFEDLFYLTPLLSCFMIPNLEDNEDGTEQSKGSIETNAQIEDDFLQKKITQKKQEIVDTYGYKKPKNFEILYRWIEKHSQDIISKNGKLQEKGLISFQGLKKLFEPGTFVCGFSNDTGASLIGYQVIFTQYQSYLGFSGIIRSFVLNMHLVVSAGDSFILVEHVEQIPQFNGIMPISSLPVKPMTKEIREILTERGRKYINLAPKCLYVSYETESFYLHNISSCGGYEEGNSIHGSSFLRSSGRVMLDQETGRKLGHYPALSSQVGSAIINFTSSFFSTLQERKMMGTYSFDDGDELVDEMKKVPESMLCLTWPAITGFSFSAKCWGHVMVDSLSEIEYQENSFEQLVLDEDRKQMIKAIVKYPSKGFQDIISGKGGGSIFLLHGPPGTGKTLTAEAVAETLHRPLYKISMGELGITSVSVERQINLIFELATIWNAIVLLDEADIFLERRGQKEISRNAIVGILMRQIEYFQGVLFLTSNRVNVFDEAFHSRISMSLKYSELSFNKRKEVWKVLLSAAGIQGLDPEQFSVHSLNGRQIKNCICLAQGMAKSENSVVTLDHLIKTIAIILEFQETLN